MADIFLSYSREDQGTARLFADALQRAGFSVWWDQSLRSGDAYDEVTERALKSAKAVVVLWSKVSVASRWVRAEAAIADRAGTLVPVMTEPCDRPIMFELRQSADLSAWKGESSDPRWEQFVDDLHVAVRGHSAATLSSVRTPQPVASRSRGAGRWIVGAAIALVLVAAGVWAFLRNHSGGQAATGAGTATLAVLPFANLSSDKEQDYFADGLTEELLNSLAGIRGLQVTSRTSSFYFKGKSEELKSVGEKLGVDNILEGSVRRDRDSLRIVAQLIKARDGFHLWSRTYDRPMKEIFKVQEEISRAVAEALQISLRVGELGQLPGMTHDVEAYQAFIEANAREGQTEATELLENAVRRDPGFTLAWVRLSTAYRGASNFAASPEAMQALVLKADDARAKAVASTSDPRLAFLGESFSFQRGEWLRAEHLYLKRTEDEARLRAFLDRGPNTIYLYRIAQDKPRQAIEMLEPYRARDPLNQRVATNLAEAYANADRLAEAIAEQQRALSISSNRVILVSAVLTAKAAVNQKMLELAWDRLIADIKDPQDLVHRLHALRNRPAEARAELRRVAGMPDRQAQGLSALWAGYFEDYDLAIRLLKEGAVPDRFFVTGLELWRPVMAGARKLPGFKDVVRRIGLVDYWRQYGWGEHCKPIGETDFECQ